MNIKWKKLLIIFAVITSIYLGWSYVSERYFAVKYFDEYLKLQNVSEENIESKELFKDWFMGGYNMIVYYTNNKDVQYIYHYSPVTQKRNGEKKYNVVDLDIVKDGYLLEEPYGADIKYPPVN